MAWEIEGLADEIVALLTDGPATIPQLEAGTGHPRAIVERALARLFATMVVEPAGEGWALLRRPALVPR